MFSSGSSPARRRRLRHGAPVLAAIALAAAACGSNGGTKPGTASSTSSQAPIVIGVSVSLTGDFSQDGPAAKQGYETWAAYQNAHGGILGRQIKLDFLSDGSSPVQVTTNYQKLITADHVDFVLGPFSSLLTGPAATVANRNGYAMIEGSGDATELFHAGLPNLFGVSAPAEAQLNTLAAWIPTAYSPQAVAYATLDDPLAAPAITAVKTALEAKGFTTAVFKTYPAETTDLSPITSAIVASGAKIVILGSSAPDGETFIQQMIQAKFNPQLLVEGSGPDSGDSFVKAIGAANDEGIMVPNTWYPGASFPENQAMVDEYMKLYGSTVQGNSQNINAAVAEAFASGQVLAQAVNHVGTVSNSELEKYLKSGATFSTVQGPVKFGDNGENVAAAPYLFQWQHQALVPVLPLGRAGVQPVETTKPAWGQSPAG